MIEEILGIAIVAFLGYFIIRFQLNESKHIKEQYYSLNGCGFNMLTKEEQRLYMILLMLPTRGEYSKLINDVCWNGTPAKFRMLVKELREQFTSCPEEVEDIIGVEGADALMEVSLS